MCIQKIWCKNWEPLLELDSIKVLFQDPDKPIIPCLLWSYLHGRMTWWVWTQLEKSFIDIYAVLVFLSCIESYLLHFGCLKRSKFVFFLSRSCRITLKTQDNNSSAIFCFIFTGDGFGQFCNNYKFANVQISCRYWYFSSQFVQITPGIMKTRPDAAPLLQPSPSVGENRADTLT